MCEPIFHPKCPVIKIFFRLCFSAFTSSHFLSHALEVWYFYLVKCAKQFHQIQKQNLCFFKVKMQLNLNGTKQPSCIIVKSFCWSFSLPKITRFKKKTCVITFSRDRHKSSPECKWKCHISPCTRPEPLRSFWNWARRHFSSWTVAQPPGTLGTLPTGRVPRGRAPCRSRWRAVEGRGRGKPLLSPNSLLSLLSLLSPNSCSSATRLTAPA